MRFGFATDTGDAQGRALGDAGSSPLPSRDEIDEALAAFRGTFLQQPPAFSAKKIDGKRSHKLARARSRDARLKPSRSGADSPDLPGSADLPNPVNVTAHIIEIVGAGVDTVTLCVECTAGFYVRSLAHDLGERLGVGAHLASLRRTRSGDFDLDCAIDLDTAERHPDRAAAAVIALPDMLPEFPAFALTADGVRRAINGCELGQRDSLTGTSPIPNPESLIRLLDPAGSQVGVARAASRQGYLHPAVVLM